VLQGRRQRLGRLLTHRCRAAAQTLDHRATRRVGQGMEESVKIGQSVKHAPNYHPANS
jgi:hypothetical protein